MKRLLLVVVALSCFLFAETLFDYSLKKIKEEKIKESIKKEQELMKILRYRIEVENNYTLPTKEYLLSHYGVDLGANITFEGTENNTTIKIINNEVDKNDPQSVQIYKTHQKNRVEFIAKDGDDYNFSLKVAPSMHSDLQRTSVVRCTETNATDRPDGTIAVMICDGMGYDVTALGGKWVPTAVLIPAELLRVSGSGVTQELYNIKDLVDKCSSLKPFYTVKMEFDYINASGENLRGMEFTRVVETNSSDVNRSFCVGVKFKKSYFLADDMNNLPKNSYGEYNQSEAWLRNIKYIYDGNYSCPNVECGGSNQKNAHAIVSDKNTSWVIVADSIDELSMALSDTHSSGFVKDGNISSQILGKINRYQRGGLVYRMVASDLNSSIRYWQSDDANISASEFKYIARNITDLPTDKSSHPPKVSDGEIGIASIGGIIRGGTHNNDDADNQGARFETINLSSRWSLIIPDLVALAELKGSSFSSFLSQKDNFRIMIDFDGNKQKDAPDRYMVLGAGSNDEDSAYWHSTESPIDIFLAKNRSTTPSEFLSLSDENKQRVKFYTRVNDCSSSNCYGDANATNLTRTSGGNSTTSQFANFYGGDLNATKLVNLYHYVGHISSGINKKLNNLSDLVPMTHTQAYNFKDLNISQPGGLVKATYDNPNATYPHAFLVLNPSSGNYERAIKKSVTGNAACIDYYNASTSAVFSGICGAFDDGVYFSVDNSIGITKKQGLYWSESINFPIGITYQSAEFAGDSNTSPLKVRFVYQFVNCWANKSCTTGNSGTSPIGQKVVIENNLNSFNGFCFQKQREGVSSTRIWWQRGSDGNCTTLLGPDNTDSIYISYSGRNNLPTTSSLFSPLSKIRDKNISLLSPSYENSRFELYNNRPLIFTLRYDDISKNSNNPHYFYRWIDDVCNVAGTNAAYTQNSLTNGCVVDNPNDVNNSSHILYTTTLGGKNKIFDALIIKNFSIGYFRNQGFFKGFIYQGYSHTPTSLYYNTATTAQPYDYSKNSLSLFYKAKDANFWFFNANNGAVLNGCLINNLSSGLSGYAVRSNFMDFGERRLDNSRNNERYCYRTTAPNGTQVNVMINDIDCNPVGTSAFCNNTNWSATRSW